MKRPFLNKMNKMKISKRNSIFAEIKESCIFSKETDYIEITEWSNMEGFDVDINGEYFFKLTWGEYELLKKLTIKLKKIR